MNNYCHFHPNSPAKWRCNHCSRFFDNACLFQADEKRQQAHCPLCQVSLTFLPAESVFEEGSAELSTQLKLSLSSENLLLLCLSTLLPGLFFLSGIHSDLNILISFTLVIFIMLHIARKSVFLAYSAKVSGIRTRSSRVRLKKSSFAMLSLSTSIQLAVLAAPLLLLPAYTFYQWHWLVGLFLILLASSGFPFLIIFSLHSSDTGSNITLGKLIHALKPHAAKLALLGFNLYWLLLLAFDLAYGHSPEPLSLMISTALSSAALLIILNASTELMLMTIRKLSSTGAEKQTNVSPKGPGTLYNQEQIANLDTDLDLALKLGQYEKVVNLLEDALKRNSQSHLRRQQLFLILTELNDHEKLARYAELFLDWMLERNRIKDASQFIYRLRKQDANFLLHDISLINQLSKHFLRVKKFALTLWLAEGIQQRFKPSEDVASILLSAAQALITHFHDLAKAEEYLLYIFQSCSEYPSAEAAKALLIHLQNNQKRQQDLKT